MSTPGAAWQRREIAESFVRDRRHLIPLIEGQDELLRRLITRGERRVRRFLDLGAGGGAFAELVMGTHPQSTGVLVDFSEPMVAAAKQRLTAHAGRWEYVFADLSDRSWGRALPEVGMTRSSPLSASTTSPTSASASCTGRCTTCWRPAASS